MPKFSRSSKEKLETCREELKMLFREVIKEFDCTILYGYRTEENQNRLFEQKKSKLKWPKSKHNKGPSMAVDVAPYYANHDPHIDWKDREKFVCFAGYVMGLAGQMNIKLRWGGAWKGLGKLNKDHYKKPFDDLVHWELIN